MTLRLLSYNICRGGGGRESMLAAVIAAASPDVVILQEARRPEVVEVLAAKLGYDWGAVRGQSLGFLSRVPLAKSAWHQPRISRHAFLELQPRDHDLRIFGLHLSAVHAAWTERRRGLELRALLRAIASHQQGFHVLVGDFNTLAPGELLDVRQLPRRLRALVWLSGGTIRWKTIASVLAAGYADMYRNLHPDDPGLTFPTWNPHVRLDYLFTPSSYASRIQACEVRKDQASAKASDHYPLLAELAAG